MLASNERQRVGGDYQHALAAWREKCSLAGDMRWLNFRP
jgi:hypothetical protein